MVQTLTNNGACETSAESLELAIKDLLEKAATERLAMREKLAGLQREVESARKISSEQTALIERLQKEKSEVESERDQYLRTLHVVLPHPETQVTEKEINEILRDGVTFDQVLEDLHKLKGA